MEKITIFQIISLVISALSVLGFGTLMVHFWNSRITKHKQDSEESKRIEKQKRKEEITEVIREEIDPIIADIDQLKTNNETQSAGLQAMLRDRMYQLAQECSKKGYYTQQELANFESMYIQYEKLGKNGVMETIRYKFLDLPDEQEFLRNNSKDSN